MQHKLTTGRVSSQLTKLTLPMVWGVFAIVAFNLADTYFVSQLGTNELAAMSFTFPVVMVLGSIAMGLGVGASSVIARAIGEGDRHHVKVLTTNSLTLALVVVGIFVAIGLVTIKPLFITLLGTNEVVFPLVRQYMIVWYWGMIFLVIPMVGNSAIRAAGNTLIPSLIMTVASVVNIALDPLLIFGFGWIPALGLQGAALATVISRATTLAASLWVLHFSERMILWRIPIAQTWGCWKKVLHVGLPAAGTSAINPISIGFITSLIAAYGAETVAGFGIASRIESFAVIALIALSASIAPFVGQNWGAQKYARVQEALRLSFIFCLIWGVFIAIFLGLTAPQLATIFDRNSEVIATASLYLRLVPISYAAYGVMLVASSTFNALGKPLPTVVLTVARMLIIYVPLAYLGSRLFGVVGIFGAACLANAVVGIVAYLWNQRICDRP
ncbi:MATE family efflux transporter [Myxosarcina sp. GI1(2024)]